MNFSLREISEKYKVPLSTVKYWNTIGDKVLNDLALLDMFIQETNITKKDIEGIKLLLNKTENYTRKKRAREAEKKLFEYFQGIENFELAVELYSLNLKKEELKNLYRLKKKFK